MMFSLTKIQKLCLGALFLALCTALPQLFHLVGLGSPFSPMHIPVILCGLVCGGLYGGICGIIGPVISSLTFSMPDTASLIPMIPELMLYGLVSGLLAQYLPIQNTAAKTYASMLPSMLLGRIAAGVTRYFLFVGQGKGYVISMWLTSHFVKSFPGIILQLILIPALIMVLKKSGILKAKQPAK